MLPVPTVGQVHSTQSQWALLVSSAAQPSWNLLGDASTVDLVDRGLGFDCAYHHVSTGSRSRPTADQTYLTKLTRSGLGTSYAATTTEENQHETSAQAAKSDRGRAQDMNRNVGVHTIRQTLGFVPSGPLPRGAQILVRATKKHKSGPGVPSKGSSGKPLPPAVSSPSPAHGAHTVVAAAAVAVVTRQREQAEVVIAGEDEDTALGPTHASNNILPSGGLGGLMNRHRALVLDSAYRPINVVNWAKAVMMDVSEKADVLEYYPAPARAYSGRGEHPLPAVVRVHTYVDMNELTQHVSCTRRNVMARDGYSCQYCGCRGGPRDLALTLDHVVPVSRGGRGTWTNLVTACMACNQKKGSQLLSQMKGWKLRTVPREPKPWEIGMVVGLSAHDLEHPHASWEPYIEPFRNKVRALKRAAVSAGQVSSSEGESESEESTN